MGLGMSISVTPLVTVVMSSVPPGEAGVASGINNAVSRASGLLALAAMGVIVLAVFNRELDSRLAAGSLSPLVMEQLEAERIKLAAAEVPAAATPEEARVLQSALDASFIEGFRMAMWMAAGLAAGSAMVAALTIGTEPSQDAMRAGGK